MRERYTYICRLSWIFVLIQKRYFYQKISALQICQMVATSRLSNKINIWHMCLTRARAKHHGRESKARSGCHFETHPALIFEFWITVIPVLCLSFLYWEKFHPYRNNSGHEEESSHYTPKECSWDLRHVQALFSFPILCKRHRYQAKPGFW